MTNGQAIAKMRRWERFTKRLRDKTTARLRRNHSPEAIARMADYLQSATQKALFQHTKPLPEADQVIDTADRLIRRSQ